MTVDAPRPAWRAALEWLTSLLVPVILVLSAIRLLLNPLYLDFEYRTPGFPDDPYGFSLQERLYWGRITVGYLLNDQGIEYLGDLRFPPGQQIPQPSCQFVDDCSRVYNDRELEHMLDVKIVVDAAMRVWQVSLLAAVTGVVAWRGGWLAAFRRAIGRGGKLTIALTAAILVFVVAAFGVIFVAFHEIFFAPGTWTFYYSDTLIRLYPERFWRDTFLYVAGLPALVGLGLSYWLRK